MKSVLSDFDTRVEEVEEYFLFVFGLDQKNAVLHAALDGSNFMPQVKLDSLLRTLKANGFLILYNLVESTMRNTVEAIIDEFESKRISFDDCRSEVKKTVITNLRRRDPGKIFADLDPVSQRIVTEPFRKKEVFSGNIDADMVRKVAKAYGFQVPKEKSANLGTVKDNRNDLAHGSKAFADVGKNYSIQQLIQIKREIIRYLDAVLLNVDDYLNKQDYLTVPPPISAQLDLKF